MADEIELQCWVLDSDIHRVFPIRIAESQTVGGLKREIKKENEQEFAQVDAKSLDLYKVSVVEDRVCTELAAIGVDRFKGAEPLQGSRRLLAEFPDTLPKGHMYVVVVQSPNGES
jgi:hypothetical protein